MRFFAQRFIFCLMATCVALAMGCSNQADNAEKLVGTWQISLGIAAGTTTFSEDFTFSANFISLLGSGETTGTWKIKDDLLITVIKTDSRDPRNVGKEGISRIVEINDSSMIMQGQEDDGEWGQRQEWKRIK